MSIEGEIDERYPYLSSYARDMAESRTRDRAAQWIGDTPYSSVSPGADKLRPKCKECKIFFNRVPDIERYVCSGCARSIPNSEIDSSPDNLSSTYYYTKKKKNKNKTEDDGDDTVGKTTTPSQLKIRTQLNQGTDSIATGGAGSTGSNYSTFKTIDPRKAARRNKKRYYGDHSRSSIFEEQTNIHPLDVELVKRGYQIKKVVEQPVNKYDTLPSANDNKDNNIISNRRSSRPHKPYPRYNNDIDD
jgi:hypothetical protein